MKAFVEACGQESGRWLRARRRVTSQHTAAGGSAGPRPTGPRFFSHLIDSHTRLFAGRDHESALIVDLARRAGSGYVFVESLSGYGKTSLFAHLVDENADFAYHFINQAYRRSGPGFNPTLPAVVLESLCQQVFLDRQVDGDLHALENLFLEFLSTPRGRPTVVLIDGVDELDPPDFLHSLLPRTLPRGVVVVLSARSQGDRSACNTTNRPAPTSFDEPPKARPKPRSSAA